MARLELNLGMMGATIEALQDAERVALSGVGRTMADARRLAAKKRRTFRRNRWARILAESGHVAERAQPGEGQAFVRSKEGTRADE